MLFVGLYYSSISVSVNAELRKSIEKSVEQEFSFVSKLGMAQMEQEIQSKVIEFTKRNQDRMAEETGIQSSLSEEDVKEYLQQVITEVKRQKTTSNKTNNGP
jgi:DNA-binding protein Fis